MIEIFVKFYFLVPVILFTVTACLILNYFHKKRHYIECTGVITDFYETSSSIHVDPGETKAISPIVSYSVNGRPYEFIGNYYCTSMKVGDQLTVLYHETDTSKATIKTGTYVGPLITGILALASIIPQVIFIYLQNEGYFHF